MVTIHLKGGLGNQMFQYAYGRAESLRKESTLWLDLSDLLFPTNLRNTETLRTFELHHFNIKALVYEPKKKPFIRQIMRKAWELIMKKERMFQSETYFKEFADIIREELTLVRPLSAHAASLQHQIISSVNPVSVHIRRGDYVNDTVTSLHHGTLPLAYYEEAISKILASTTEPVFFIFSDDIEWTKKHFESLPYHFIFVSDGIIPAHEELILMSSCNHHIIANSSFSWWGAWLGRNNEKIVIAPRKWFADVSINTDKMIPKNWMRI